MYQDLEPARIKDFSGGINKSTPADNIQDNELDECLNMDLLPDGTLTSRDGCTQYNSTATGAGRITSLYYAKTTSGGGVSRIMTTLAKIYKDNGAGGWTDITGGTAPPSNTLWMWRTFNNIAIGVNGTSVPQKHTPGGGACADLGGTPADKCSIIEINSGRVYLAGDGDELTALHGSAAGNAEDWTTAGDAFTIFVDKDNGHPITGLAKFFTDLIIFKRKGVYKLYNPTNNPTDMQIIQIFDDIGCISPYSIKQIGNELVWEDDDGVYSLQATQNFGDVAYASVSKKIQPYIDDTQYSLLSESYACDIRPLAQYRLSIPKSGASQNNHIIVRDYLHSAWLRREGIAYACYGKWEISSQIFYMAGGYDGKVYKIDVGSDDNGVSFEKTVKSKRFTFGTSQLRKLFKRIYMEYLIGATSTLVFSIDIDYGKVVKARTLNPKFVAGEWDTAKWDQSKWGGSAVSKRDISLGKKGRSAQFRWSNGNRNQPFTLFKYEVGASLLSRRG